MAKGKVRKHTAKEIQKKIDSHRSKGGGKKGAAARKPKCKLVCKVCMLQSPSITTLAIHYSNKHPRVPFNPADYGVVEEEKQTKPAPKKPAAAPKEEKQKSYPPNDKIKVALTKLYTEKAPEKLGNIDKIMTKYDGKWDKLEEGLSKKFGAIDLNAMCK
mmetsp:Transcript_30475/g.42448  ORF Transcript_30475/g.42448 Transcript_30475/m.42448 type:complete len:159 (-) Transcript_30475:358-834(-)|eukprot:CAMPEP_0185252410 /NCGR_PEP_ID=MMETSP1359-20130426/1504_1 /TAXON_ID=552665 /ORGANISM="Bigelowiella longifila, Strain CCMP242" /LENGTH=158 /DNA_ID=CAMNT_0027834569 /DNA_START=66 /DNA_END=542 /DNA_ORIENTATION=+